ncbi:MAG: hypothetical protein WD449_01515 [Candidatus Babeliales bacterium]
MIPGPSIAVELHSVAAATHECTTAEINFLPDEDSENGRSKDIVLERLQYLTTLKADAAAKSPFTQEQYSILHNSDRLGARTKKGLIWGNGLAIALWSSAAILPILNGPSIALLTTAIGLGMVGNTLSLWTTGWAPDQSSNAYNERQDMLYEFSYIYQNLGRTLLARYLGKETQSKEAQRIAEALNAPYIMTLIAQKINNTRRAEMIMRTIIQAINYIKNQKHPEDQHLDQMIRNNKQLDTVKQLNVAQLLETFSQEELWPYSDADGDTII